MIVIDQSRLGVELATRLTALDRLLELSAGRVDDKVLTEPRQLVDHVNQRVRLSPVHTVVALAGTTGSGKSSIFNTLAGIELSEVSVRRPTTADALACIWEPRDSGPLLHWLGVSRQRQVARESALDAVPNEDLAGLVLLDLPDHDTVAVDHRLQVDKLVETVDLLVWVMDPQKYADATVHERYLRPLARHGAATLILLNQVDRLEAEEAEDCLNDLAGLLASDGLRGVPLIATSARTGQGVAQLRMLLAERVAARHSYLERLVADVDRVTDDLAPICAGHDSDSVASGSAGPAGPGGGEVAREDRETFFAALAEAAGVGTVAEEGARSYRQRVLRYGAWPVASWLRPAGQGDAPPGTPVGGQEASSVVPVQRTQVDSAVRSVTEAAARGLPRPWAESVRRAGREAGEQLPDRLDAELADTDLTGARPAAWWPLIAAAQWLLLIAAVLGVVMSVAAVFIPAVPMLGPIPLPTLLFAGTVLGGLALAAASRVAADSGARRARRQVEARLRARIDQVADEVVLRAVAAELDWYREAQAQFVVAKGR